MIYKVLKVVAVTMFLLSLVALVYGWENDFFLVRLMGGSGVLTSVLLAERVSRD